MESRRLQGGVDSAVRPGLVSESEIVADEEKENDSINSQTDSDQDEYIAIIREAFLVEEDTGAEIIEATLVEPSPPWWKMCRAEQMFFFVILLRCQYLLALIAHPTITEINFAEQRSEQIELVAGQAYYFEALMKKSRDFDHFAIAWEYPGQHREVIPADFSRTTRPNIDHNS